MDILKVKTRFLPWQQLSILIITSHVLQLGSQLFQLPSQYDLNFYIDKTKYYVLDISIIVQLDKINTLNIISNIIVIIIIICKDETKDGLFRSQTGKV